VVTAMAAKPGQSPARAELLFFPAIGLNPLANLFAD
jgi:hypothetical protein